MPWVNSLSHCVQTIVSTVVQANSLGEPRLQRYNTGKFVILKSCQTHHRCWVSNPAVLYSFPNQYRYIRLTANATELAAFDSDMAFGNARRTSTSTTRMRTTSVYFFVSYELKILPAAVKLILGVNLCQRLETPFTFYTSCLVPSYTQQILCILGRKCTNSVGLASCCVESQITCWFDSLVNDLHYMVLTHKNVHNCLSSSYPVLETLLDSWFSSAAGFGWTSHLSSPQISGDENQSGFKV